MGYQWEWSWLWKYRAELTAAFLYTIELNACVIAIGVAVGAALCSLRVVKSNWVRVPTACLVEVLRAMPALVIMIWLFFCLPILLGWATGGPIRISGWTTAVAALSVSAGAYFAEIFRAALASIPAGEVQAGLVCGLSRWDIATRIALPHALRASLPPLANQCATVIKLSSLASFIAVPEMLHQATALIHETFRPLEFYTFVALAYLAMIIPVTLLSAWAEHRYGVRHG